MPFLEELEAMKVEFDAESTKASDLWKTLEEDEQNLERMRDELERMEREKSQLNQDKAVCKEKLEKGKRLLGNKFKLSK